MDLGIKGRKAIVAGASAGMGYSSAKALAIEGVDIILSARGEARLLSAASKLTAETGAKVIPIVADHSTEAGRARLLEACPEPDIMVITCAPPRITETYRDITMDEWRESLDTTLIGPIELMRLALDGMIERGFGRIVNIGTGAAKAPAMIRLLSGPARSALLNYTAAISKSLCQHNVIINNILPGMFHTATIAERFNAWAADNGTSYDEEVEKFITKWNIPAGRFGDPDDLGAFVAMFCSRQANFTVGQSLVIDGGMINALY